MSKKWADDNPERVKARKKEWAKGRKRTRDPEKMRQYNQKWVENNREKRKEVAREWASQNPESGRRANNRRRARKRDLPCEPYSEAEVLERYGYFCHICGKPIDLNAARKPGVVGWEMGLHLDHAVPLAAGGPDTLNNVRPSHGLCNLRKNGRLQ